ncbi:reverse transcriptase domain-containing protein [Tanacetum coccineum]
MKLSEPKKHSPQSTKDHTFLTTFPKTLLIHRVTKACPEVLSQGTADLSHQGRKIRKEKRCSKGWKMVYSTGLETRGRVCPHTRMTQGVSRTIAVAEILRAVTRAPALEEQSLLLLRNTITKKHPHTGRKLCRKAKPWVYEETETFTPRIRYFDIPKRNRMPSHVKTYDGSEDPEDHLKIFQAAAKVERWAMPTWCHMFFSTLTGSARQKKCIKDPVEIHHIKQREGESTEDFVRRFKVESRDVKWAPEIMRISGFMHGITNPELIKPAGNQERKKSLPPWKQQEAGHKQNFKKGGFKNQQRSERRQDRFTLLLKSPKEIMALEKGKFKVPPPMTTPIKKRNNNKFCEFNGEVGHNTDECMHLKRQIEELLKNGKLSHVIKELKQNSGKDQPKQINMKLNPKNDVQKLNGKLASLNKFLAKSTEKSLPFFKTLKKCTKKSDFHWTEEAEATFKKMKQLIAELPTLTAPEEKEELIVYLAAAKEVVSAVLMIEREAKQMPIISSAAP